MTNDAGSTIVFARSANRINSERQPSSSLPLVPLARLVACEQLELQHAA
ncbi:MAG: hypothetical protein ABIN13_03235 [Mucilaginibacter sp.]